MAKKIYISPSNQNGNRYSYGETNECDQCNRIAEAAEKHLERNGYEVKRAPKGQDMNKSIRESNAWGADVHIPIHTNAANGNAHGALVMVYSKASENMKYAQPVYDELSAISPQGGGYGIRRDVDLLGYGLAEIRGTSAIAVYCECEFHDNATLAKWIVENVDEIGQAIAKGVCSADGKEYIPEQQPSPDVFYRVFDATGTQKGAFREIDNAFNAAKQELISGKDVKITVKK